MKKRWMAGLLGMIMAITPLAAAAPAFAETTASEAEADEAGTHTYVDAAGREVEIPDQVERLAIVQMVLPVMCYALQGHTDNFVAIPPASHTGWEGSMLETLAPSMGDVDIEVINNDREINMEALMNYNPDLVISFTGVEDQASQLEAMGIPVVLLNSAQDLATLEDLISQLGEVLNCQDRAEELLNWYSEKEAYVDSKKEAIDALSDEEKPRVLNFQNVNDFKIYPTGVNASIVERTGGQNIVLTGDAAEVSSPSMEQIMEFDPEVIFISNFDDVTPDDFYNNVFEGQDWSSISAVKNHRVYKVPLGLYRWAPPNTVEKPLYMLWIASKLQPEIFSDLDLEQEIRDFYQTYLHYELSDEEYQKIIKADINANSEG